MNRSRPITNFAMFWAGLLFVMPFLFMLLVSFKPEKELMTAKSVIPKNLDLSNYKGVIHNSVEAPIGMWFLNSVFISAGTTLIVLITASLAAFAISRLKVRGARFVLGLVVLTMMIPSQLMLIPMYVILSRMHLLDTPYALMLPASAGGFGVFMLSQFMQGLPSAIEEAALIDGCSVPQLYWKVTMPLCGPALATLGVFTFIGSWNDYINPLVYMESVTNYTLPVGIALFQSSYSTQYGLIIATSIISTLPLLIIFLVFQKQIIESMTSSGLKD